MTAYAHIIRVEAFIFSYVFVGGGSYHFIVRFGPAFLDFSLKSIAYTLINVPHIRVGDISAVVFVGMWMVGVNPFHSRA